MGKHWIGRGWHFAAIGLAFSLLSGTQQALADDLSAAEALLKKLKQSPRLEIKGGSGGTAGPIQGDVRRQKEEAAKSLNETIKEQDDRTRARALESGRGVIITQ